MTEQEIRVFVNNQLIQATAGYNVETNKLDLKRAWYQLSKSSGEFEFLKDATAIANSYGGGHGFIVVGYDEKERKIYKTSFADSGLSDVSELHGIIKKRIDRPFTIEIFEHEFSDSEFVSIIHILPSTDKPHVIRNYVGSKAEYPNEIFIRKGTTAERASKFDLDLMYAEKDNIRMDRKAFISISKDYISFSCSARDLSFSGRITIENVGFRNLVVAKIIALVPDPTDTSRVMRLEEGRFAGTHLRISPNDIWHEAITFSCPHASIGTTWEQTAKLVPVLNDAFRDNTGTVDIKIILSDGSDLDCTVNIRK